MSSPLTLCCLRTTTAFACVQSVLELSCVQYLQSLDHHLLVLLQVPSSGGPGVQPGQQLAGRTACPVCRNECTQHHTVTQVPPKVGHAEVLRRHNAACDAQHMACQPQLKGGSVTIRWLLPGTQGNAHSPRKSACSRSQQAITITLTNLGKALTACAFIHASRHASAVL